MSRLIPFGAFVSPFVILSAVCFGGCASSGVSSRASVLALPYSQFDQTFGSGWRPIFDRQEYGQAAALIEDYLRSHHELTVGQQKFLHLHAAMLLALEGRNSRAIKHADQAVCHETAPELGQSWNDMVAATTAFLAHERAALLAARERLVAAQYPQIKYIDRLCVHQVVTGEQRPPRSTVWFEHELQSGQMITSPNQCAPVPASSLGADN